MATTSRLPIDARRVRNYTLRLPLATRAVVFLLLAFYVAHLLSPGLDQWGALIPKEIDLNNCTQGNIYFGQLCVCVFLD